MRLRKLLLVNNNCYKRGVYMKPQGVMVHSTGANNPWLKRYVGPDDGFLGQNQYNNHWNMGGLNVCVHAFIGKLADGTIATYQTLPWDMRGWHCASGPYGSGNNTHISFEICEDGLADPVYFAKVYTEAVELTAHLCCLYEWDPLADGVVICHSEGHDRGIASNHGDVEHWFPKHGKTMDDFRADVASAMGKEIEQDMDQAKFKALFLEMRKELQDNDASEYSREAREWAVSTGLVQGGSGDEFNGMWEDLLTREQMATLLYRFAKMVGVV